MENPISTVTGAAKSALGFRNMIVLVFGLVAVFAIMEALGKTAWLISPIASWKASRAPKTSSAPTA